MSKELIDEWFKLVPLTQADRERAEKNLGTCMSCPDKREDPILHCDRCGCALKARVLSNCPAGKFLRV